MKTKTIKQTVDFTASPRNVFEALMDSKKHSTFTGAKASISREIGGRVMAYDGYIQGTNLEIEPYSKIVQAWYASEPDWPNDHLSRVSFVFEETKSGTRLHFTHFEVPEKCFESLSKGWKEHYWDKMKKMLEKEKK